MLLLVADENFNNNILRGLLRRQPKLDIVRIQDTEAAGANDPTVLEWISSNTHQLLLKEGRHTCLGIETDQIHGLGLCS